MEKFIVVAVKQGRPMMYRIESESLGEAYVENELDGNGLIFPEEAFHTAYEELKK